MALKIAKNSLFAVLLRSPWWISILVAVVFVLASRALLPADLVVFGAIGCLPFLVIGCIAAWRQWRQPSAATVQRVLETAAGMGSREFTALLARAYQRAGYEQDPSASDATVDLVLKKDGRTTLVACRRWKASNQGVEPLRALAQARQARDASHGVYVLLGEPADKTRRFAAEHQIDLLGGSALAALLRPVVPPA